MAGTSRPTIQSIFETTAAGEYETFEGNPGNCNGDAFDVAPPEPATEDESAAEPAPCGPVVQELHLTLDNPTDRALLQLGTLPKANSVRSAILHHSPCHPKILFAISSENGNRRIFSEKHYHAHYGAMEIERQRL